MDLEHLTDGDLVRESKNKEWRLRTEKQSACNKWQSHSCSWILSVLQNLHSQLGVTERWKTRGEGLLRILGG